MTEINIIMVTKWLVECLAIATMPNPVLSLMAL
jgi:hypothetical protein